MQWTPFADISRSETTIRNLGKILKNSLRRSLFLNLIKLNISSCNLLKMNSIRRLSRTLSKFYTIRYGLFEFSEHLFQGTLLLYVLGGLVFQNNSKYMLCLLSNRAIFCLEYFYLKNHRIKQVPSFSLPWWEEIPSLLFIMSSWFPFTPLLFKNFSLLTKL